VNISITKESFFVYTRYMKKIISFGKKLYEFISQEPVLLCIVFGVILFLFGHVISGDSLLWGWNTPAHIVPVTEMVEYISSGTLSGYTLSWSGGVPLFVLYPPLVHALIALLFVVSPLGSLEFFFSFVIFLSLPLYVISLWYSTKTFFDKGVGKMAILFSLMYVLFPGKLYVLGIGATGTFFMGFFNAVWGISFALLALAFLKKLYDVSEKKEKIRYSIFFSFFVALTFLTHTLSFIGLLFFIVLFSLFHAEIRSFLYSLGGGIGAFLLTSFFAVPFFSNLWLSSGRALRFDLFGGSPFFYTFPFDFSFLRDFSDTSFNLWGAVFLLFFLIGAYLSVKEKKYDGVFFWIIGALIFGTTYGITMFPSLSIHYYRMMPFLLSFALMVASYGVVILWRRSGGYVRGGIGLLVIALFSSLLFFSFDVGSGENTFSSQGLFSTYESSYSPQKESYVYYEETEKVLSFLGTLPVQRFFSESSSVSNAGTPHYLMSLSPLLYDQPSVFGLFVESSSQTPFLVPSLEGMMGSRVEWGDDRLSEKITSFLEQSLETHLKRVGMFGVSHLITREGSFADRLNESDMVKSEFSNQYYSVFSLKEYAPLVYELGYKPGVYMNLDGTLPFRDIAMALFEGEESFDVPLVEWKGEGTDLIPYQDAFSFLVVSGGELPKYREVLESMSLPLIILNPEGRIEHHQRYYIYDFEPLSYSRVYPSVPSASFAWKQLQDTTRSLLLEEEVLDVIVTTMEDESILIKGKGPVVINAGYSPYWTVTSPCEGLVECSVWHLSPSQMLVFADGDVALTYRSSHGWWGIVSLLVFLLSLGGLWYVRK